MTRRASVLVLLAAAMVFAGRAVADETTVNGYLEMNYSYNFNRPGNRITALRGFDDRHAQFQLSNLAVDVTSTWSPLTVRLVLQAGETPNVYYAAEPSPERTSWRHIQQAALAFKPKADSHWLFETGLFLSPIGPEGIAIKDDWNWSRSNLFYGLPFYHLGARATHGAGEKHAFTLAAYNGWNNIEDNNDRPSISAQWLATYNPKLKSSLLYFGGDERSTGALEGDPRRDLLDAWTQWDVNDRVSLLLHGDVGRERNNYGTSSWSAAALAVRGKLAERWYLAARTDRFVERVPAGASPIFWSFASDRPRRHVASHTLTLDYRPAEKLSIRLEARRDSASGNAFFDGDTSDPNARHQTTLTAGAVAWF